jgi:aspartyl protease family protein
MRIVYFLLALPVLLIFLSPDTQLAGTVTGLSPVWTALGALIAAGFILGQILRPKLDLTRFDLTWANFRVAALGLAITAVLMLVENALETSPTALAARQENPALTLASAEVLEAGSRAELALAADGLFRGTAIFNGSPVAIMVDTGASLVLLRYEDAKAIGLDVSALEFNVPVTTAAGNTTVARTVFEEIQLGDILVKNVPGSVAAPGSLQSNLLGMSFLQALSQTVIQGNRLILQK